MTLQRPRSRAPGRHSDWASGPTVERCCLRSRRSLGAADLGRTPEERARRLKAAVEPSGCHPDGTAHLVPAAHRAVDDAHEVSGRVWFLEPAPEDLAVAAVQAQLDEEPVLRQTGE